MFRRNLAVTLFVGSFALLAPRLADAHFMLTAPPNWWTQLSDGTPQKTPPCGNEVVSGTTATGSVTVYQPGQTLAVTVTATIAHPGWWRISLRQGAAATQNATNFPDPPELGAAGSALQCTPAFITNPVWSPTQPVLADKLGLPAGSNSTTTTQSGTQTFQVTIPATATCTTASPCTLQVLMIMTDHAFPTCNYHHCANIVSATGTTTGTGGATGATDAGVDVRVDARADAGGTTGVGGSVATGSGGGPGTGAGVGGSSPGTTTGIGGATGTTAGTGGATGTTTGTGGATGSTTADAGGTTDDGKACSCSTSGPAASWAAIVTALGAIAVLRRRRRTR